MPDQKLNWAVVGLGDIVRKRVGPALLAQPRSKLHACVTRDASVRADDLASLQPERVYTEFEAMLADRDVDAVYLATPVFLHAPQALAALQAGKHVIVEKPIALDARQGQAIRAAVRQSGRHLAVAYYRRFWPTFERVKEMLAARELGQVVLVRAALHSWYAPKPDDLKAWRVRPPESGGGVLSDVGSHRLDLLAWWFGLPSRIVADMGTRTHSFDVEDSVTALMTFDNQIPCTLSFQWNSKTWADELQIVGTEASVTIAPLDGNEIRFTRGSETTRWYFDRPANAHYGLIDDFANAICAGWSPRFTEDDGLAATLIADWMRQSSALRAWVEN
jgi:1,5-anhydro-D-fructose reductase (1,5-anhydro-D-mannitol-forming)